MGELATDWLCLDCELMPWSSKAQELLRQQYAPVGNSGVQALRAEQVVLAKAAERTSGLNALLEKCGQRLDALNRYVREYRQYCWPVNSLDDLKLAPFHLLASEGAVHTDKRHTWHMEMLARFCTADERLLLATPFQIVDLNDSASCNAATSWWTDMTSVGREGMVVKPLDFITKGRRGLVQPAVKCRGPEYLQDHLRPGVSPSGKPCPVAFQSGWRETLPGSAGVRAGCRGIGKVRSERTPAENS